MDMIVKHSQGLRRQQVYDMKTFTLDGTWSMLAPDGSRTEGKIPGSVYSFLLDAGKMEDPYYRDHEFKALELVKSDYTFTKTFDADPALLSRAHQVLRFDGVDTISDIYLNGMWIGSTMDMHTAYEFDVRGLLLESGNELKVCIKSPTRWIAQRDKEHHLGGSIEAMKGFSYLRKAHCMFGWDWGPRLPDEGIWKDVTLLGWNDERITDVRIHQNHLLEDGSAAMGASEHAAQAKAGRVRVQLTVKAETSASSTDGADSCAAASHSVGAARSSKAVSHGIDSAGSGEAAGQTGSNQICGRDDAKSIRIELTAPDGQVFCLKNGEPFEVERPQLWWPNGLGSQPLYTVTVSLLGREGEVIERQTRRIGLRTMTMRRKKDQWGETFATEANGQTFFAMGADYIPEDNILSRRSPERTKRMLGYCRESHFNAIRVWGGGFYPDDWFFDYCDEYGLVVWEDLMFACAFYPSDEAFYDEIREEIRQNVRRIRHHASLGLWCCNNEMEGFTFDGGYECNAIMKADYLIQNEYVIPQILKEEDPDTFWWPSSPSSGGKLDNPSDPSRGDVHYWNVWHGGVPFTEYRKFRFRYLSEFGFQSFPCLTTVKSFTGPQDRNIFSYVMEMHQRNAGANGKIMMYLSQNYRYPETFENLLYASQLLQAEAIKYGVEHFRRNRNDDRCMGAIYWQLNDIWPVASWASLDYYYRWKALQYYAKRFFTPVMLSCEENGMASQGLTCISEPEPHTYSARLCLTNETWDVQKRTVVWELRDESSCILKSGRIEAEVKPFSSEWFDTIDVSDADIRSAHLHYALLKEEETQGAADGADLAEDDTAQGSVLFVPAKHYRFADPHLELDVNRKDRTVTVIAEAYAKSVEIYSAGGYVRLDDNFFDMEKGSRTLQILEGDMDDLKVRSVFDI